MDPKAGGGEEEEDDCVDSGAETGGSDYSHMSSTSSELSVEDTQDPFLVSVHVITDPGESKALQEAIDKVLAWVHPDLQLFRVSERRVARKRKRQNKISQPALAVVLFLQEEYGEEQILELHETFQRPPWHYHHTEQVHGRFLPYLPCSQDFFTLAPGTPLWALRPVHYGKEIIRFTIYCRHENFADILKLYELILKRNPSQRKSDFCIFPIYSNLDVDIQFSLKRLPSGQTPVPTDSSVLEFRVKDIGQLVPLLPNPCSPISEGRWQTEDHDGNKILLQAHSLYRKSSKASKLHFYPEKTPSFPPSSSFIPRSRTLSSGQQQQLGGPASGLYQPDLPPGNQGGRTQRNSSAHHPPWSFQRSKSLFCLPTGGAPLASDSLPLVEPLWVLSRGSPAEEASEQKQNPKLSVDDLEGAQETDVDTGLKLSFSDLSVVSAYSAPSGFCNNLETFLPPRKCHPHQPKLGASKGRPLSASSSMTAEAPCTSLSSFTEGSSGSPPSSTASPFASSSTLKETSGPPASHSSEIRETSDNLQQLAAESSPTHEIEEFYI
ncbi:protein FAM124A isoform X1 [Vombatus ursinus]|uniref:Family with sequence similarity 124 member A n=1 Tax=Vombatus ursinus TaxID=29139 RepID=A0A4X2LED6_VOMUR|nr:protein FAM124A isoform X1 [Vombatus ursinus]